MACSNHVQWVSCKLLCVWVSGCHYAVNLTEKQQHLDSISIHVLVAIWEKATTALVHIALDNLLCLIIERDTAEGRRCSFDCILTSLLRKILDEAIFSDVASSEGIKV